MSDQAQATTNNNGRPVKKEHLLRPTRDDVEGSVLELLRTLFKRINGPLGKWVENFSFLNALFLLGFVGLSYVVVFHHHLIVIHVHPVDWCEGEKAKAKVELDDICDQAKSVLAKDQAFLFNIASFAGDVCQGYNQAKTFAWVAKVAPAPTFDRPGQQGKEERAPGRRPRAGQGRAEHLLRSC